MASADAMKMPMPGRDPCIGLTSQNDGLVPVRIVAQALLDEANKQSSLCLEALLTAARRALSNASRGGGGLSFADGIYLTRLCMK